MLKKIVRKLFKEKKVPIYTKIRDGEVLKGKNAIVTGGSSGIGFSIAEDFVKNGCNVVIIGANEEKLKKACDKLKNTKFYTLDIEKTELINENIRNITKLFKNNKIYILVNCAGVTNNKSFF